MNFKNKILAASLFMTVLFYSLGTEAAVTIKGKNLDNIDDIVNTASGGSAELKKHSLGIFSYIEGYIERGQSIQTQHTELAVRQFQNNGTAASTKFDGKFTNSYGLGHGNSGRQAAVSSISGKSGKAVLWVDYHHDYSNKKLFVYPQAAMVVNKDSTLSISSETPKLELSTSANENLKDSNMDSCMQDVKGGIFLPDDNKEYFALSFTENTQIGQGAGNRYCSALVFIVGMEIKDDKVTLSDTKVMIERDLNQEYSPASIAVGDFTGTGTTNEIALVTADKAGIYLSVYRLKNNNGTYSYDTVVKSEKVCSYTGRMKNGTVQDIADFAAAEALAGDFDGDGKTEIAVVYKDDVQDVGSSDYAWGKINVRVYKWNNGSFKSENANTSYNYLSQGPRTYILGFKSARADLDGDGKDEIAVLLIAIYEYLDRLHYNGTVYPYLTRWYCDQGSIKPKYDSSSLKGGGVERYGVLNTSQSVLFGSSNGVFHYYNDIAIRGKPLYKHAPYVQRTYSIVAGPFTGTMGKIKTVDDIAVSWAGNSDFEFNKDYENGSYQHVYLFKNNLNNNNFSSFGDAKEIFSSRKRITKIALAAGDFFGEGVELEAPVHLKIDGNRNYAAIIQTPPYHVDYIPVPWESDQTPKLTNFTYSPALKSTYTHKKEGSTGQDIKFDMKSSVETIEEVGLDSTKTGILKKVAGFILDKAGGDSKILDGLVDKVDLTKSEVNKTSNKIVMTDQMETSTADRVLYYTTGIHMWRYPIKNPAPSWLFKKLQEGTNSTGGDKFLTFTIADEAVFNSSASFQDNSYQPLHEEGNLFSYPTSVAQIEGYANKQKILTGQSSIAYSPGSHTQTINVTSEASKSTTEGKTVKFGTISKTIGQVKVLAGKSTANSLTDERGNTSTFTKSYSTTDPLTAAFPNPQGDYANVTFTTDLQAYADEAGILTLGFAVKDFNSTARLWRDSIYRQKADPALYLPNRYLVQGDKVTARTDEYIATRIRGIRFYVPDTGSYTGPVLYANGKYRIDVPIYNASFVAPSVPVEVALSYRDKGKTEKTLIAKKSVTIGGWEAGKDSNKAMLQFDFTAPEKTNPGQKELIVEIDPDNKIDEIHENWSAKVPGGNNNGYFDFSVVSVTGLNAGGDENLKNSDFEITIDGKSIAEFITYAAGKSEAFDAKCVITNKHGENHLIYTLELGMIDSDDDEIETISHNVGILNTGESYSFSFIAYPQDWKDCDELQTTIHYEAGTVIISSLPDKNEKPLIANGIVQRKISKKFTFSNSTPVCWKIDKDNIKLSASDLTTAADSDSIEIETSPSNAETTPTNKIDVTVSTVAGKTTANGKFSIPVMTSPTGEAGTWTNKENITFDVAEVVEEYQNNSGTTGSSGSGCELGFSVFSLVCIISFALKT